MGFRSTCWSLGSALALVTVAPGAIAQETPVSQTLLVTTGTAPGAHMGVVVGSAGDANGDGRGDFLAGSENAITVISGANGQILYAIPADTPGDFDLATAGAVGDVDGDGRSDLLIAAPQADQQGQPDTGALYLYSAATGQRIWGVPGPGAGARLGASVTLLGDITGDGVPDLLAGAPEASVADLAQAGRAFVLSLTTGQTSRSFSGSTAGGRLGAAVAALGDITGDRVPDFVIGAPDTDVTGRPKAGRIFVVSGADVRNRTQYFGLEANTRLGASLATLGDVNGDGRVDLAIGAPGRAVGGQAGTGVVFVFSVLDRRILYTLTGPGAGEGFGTVVVGGGDVNGDGRPDLAVGTPLANVDGRVQSGRVQIFSGPDGQALLTLSGNAGDQMGRALSFAGDLNGDSRSDLIVGAPFFDVIGAPDVGLAGVIGLPGAPPVNPPAPTGNGNPGPTDQNPPETPL